MKNVEPIILTVALALLALVAAGVAYYFPSIEDLTTITTVEPSGHQAVALKADDLSKELAVWSSPTVWNEAASHNHLFKADGYFFYPGLYPTGNYLQKDDGTATTPGGVLISWCQKYNLDITDPNIDREDPDKDGFSNKTEFFAGLPIGTKTADGSKSTSPIDPEKHPTYISRLRLQNYDQHPFHIQFVGVVSLEGKNVFQIAISDLPSSQQPPLKKAGDALGFEDWVVGAYTPKMVEETDAATGLKNTVDRSTLEIDRPATGQKVILPLQETIIAPDSTANFVMLMPSQIGQVIKTPMGKTFVLPLAAAPAEYLVLDVTDKGAVIRDTKTNEQINVPKLDPNDWNDVPVVDAAPATNPNGAPAAAPAGAQPGAAGTAPGFPGGPGGGFPGGGPGGGPGGFPPPPHE
jgi:hypothetical protein